MIANRGAVAAALERWNERRRGIFYPKTDIDFDLEALRRRKEDLKNIDVSKIANVLDQEVRSIEFLPNAGTSHALFRVRTASQCFILKLAAEEAAFGFSIEHWASRRLQEARLPSLNVAAFEVLPQSLPCPFLLMEEASGQTLTRFEDSETQAMPEPLLFELGRVLGTIHQIPGKGAGLLDCGSLEWPEGLHARWRDYVSLRLDEHLRVCREIGAINDEESRKAIQYFEDANDLLNGASVRLLHGDPGHHNVFSDGQRITAIIDWEDALCGDPIFDIAYWGTFVRDEMRERFLDGYRSIEKLPSDFERRYWLYYLRVALSKTVHRFRFGTKDRPGRPSASLRIQKALSKLAEL
jgi:hygromycin-B 4-O-kinase